MTSSSVFFEVGDIFIPKDGENKKIRVEDIDLTVSGFRGPSILIKTIESAEPYGHFEKRVAYNDLLREYFPEWAVVEPKVGMRMRAVYWEIKDIVVSVRGLNEFYKHATVLVITDTAFARSKGWIPGKTQEEPYKLKRFYAINPDGSFMRKDSTIHSPAITSPPEQAIISNPLIDKTNPYYFNNCPEWDDAQKRDFLRHLVGG